MDGACICDPGYASNDCGECDDGFVRADDGSCAAETCTGEGCEPPDECDAGQCCTAECVHGSKECDGDQVRYCDAQTVDGCNAWSPWTDCEDEDGCSCEATPEVAYYQWGSTGADKAYAVRAAAGRAYVVGSIGGSYGGSDFEGIRDMFVLAKDLDSTAPDWHATWGSSGADNAWNLTMGPGGELFVAGKMSGSFDDSGHAGAGDASITQFTAKRERGWHTQFGTFAIDEALAITRAADGHLYVAGATGADLAAEGAGNADFFLSKLDDSGDVEWTEQWGSGGSDYALSIALADDGDILVSGSMDEDFFCRRMSSEGDERWTRTWGTPARDVSAGLAILANGDIIVSGSTAGSLVTDPPGAAVLSRLSPGGEVQWTEQFGATSIDYARDVVASRDGGYYVAGEVGGALVEGGHEGGVDAFVQKRDADGTVEWTRQFGTSEYDDAVSIDVASDGKVVVTGTTFGSMPGNSNRGSGDMFLIVIAP